MKNLNRKVLLITALISFCVLILAYNNCSQNQFTKVYGGSGLGNPMTPVTNELLFGICGVITRCNTNVTIDQCLNGVSNVSGAGLPLNLSSNYSTLNNITQGEQSGTLIGNSTASAACYESINTLTCSNPLVQGAYVSSSSNSFGGAVNLISSQSCGNALAPATQYSCSSRVFLRGVANTTLAPIAFSSGTSYSISPALPTGLSIDSTTGIISGSATVVTPQTSYTVSAMTPSGAVSKTTLLLRTADGYMVNDLSDNHNVGPGCLTSSGKCTLRAAIEAINNGASSNVVVLPSGQINLTLASELIASKSQDIYGDCAQKTIIDGQGSSRVFHITGGPTSFQNIVVQNGKDSGSGGGGIYVDGQSGSVSATLQNIIVQNNSYTASSYGGGGIAAGGTVTLTMSNSTIQNNSAPAAGGGGLDVLPGAQVTANQVIFQNNSASTGGGVVIDGSATISQSLIINNSAMPNVGGGVYCSNSNGSVTLINDTLYGNSAVRGAGIEFGNSGVINVVNSTITNNTSSQSGFLGGAGFDTNGGGSAVINLTNSIVSGNYNNGSLSNCYSGAALVTSKGHNISDDSDCALSSSGDLQNTNPKLAPLQGNGGYSQTLALLPGSPAIDAASTAACPSIDQRGSPRLTDGKCDIGAFEVQ